MCVCVSSYWVSERAVAAAFVCARLRQAAQNKIKAVHEKEENRFNFAEAFLFAVHTFERQMSRRD